MFVQVLNDGRLAFLLQAVAKVGLRDAQKVEYDQQVGDQGQKGTYLCSEDAATLIYNSDRLAVFVSFLKKFYERAAWHAFSGLSFVM